MLTSSTTEYPRRPLRWVILCAAVASVIVLGVFTITASTSARGLVTPPPTRTTTTARAHQSGAPSLVPGGERLQRTGNGGPDAADGVLPGRVSVFDNEYAGITNLNPQMLAALRRAAADANDDGIAMYVDSGWRSRAYQAQLFDQAVAQYGSEAAAARWVARPGTSVHEAGLAVDIGGTGAASWLSRHGAAYGLCRMYGNEPWHFEWRPEAVANGCPTMYADPTHDPRLGK